MKQRAGKKYCWLFAAATISVFLKIYGLSLYPFNGDEYGSIAVARGVAYNFNSILYFLFLKAWALAGFGEIWLRLPAVCFGVATVIFL